MARHHRILTARTFTDPDPNSMDSTNQTMTRDPVCGMSVDPATAKYSHVHEGATWYFCADDCRQQFVANPAQFLKKEDGPVAKRPRPSLTREVLIAIAVFAAVATLLVMARGITRQATGATPQSSVIGMAAGRDQAIDAGQGGVISRAAFERGDSSATELTFTVTLDTHTVDLSSFNPASQVRLRQGTAEVAPQTAVGAGERSAHHQNYRLTFPAVGSGPAFVVIRDVAGVNRNLPFSL